MASVIVVLKFSVLRLVYAAVLPVMVRVQLTPPFPFDEAALQAAVKPVGSPETRLMLAPERLVGSVTLPNGVAVSVKVAEDMERTVCAAGETSSVTPGACKTCTLNR